MPPVIGVVDAGAPLWYHVARLAAGSTTTAKWFQPAIEHSGAANVPFTSGPPQPCSCRPAPALPPLATDHAGWPAIGEYWLGVLAMPFLSQNAIVNAPEWPPCQPVCT